MTDKKKVKLLYDFALDLYNRGLAHNPEEWDYEKIAWEYIIKKSKSSKNND